MPPYSLAFGGPEPAPPEASPLGDGFDAPGAAAWSCGPSILKAKKPPATTTGNSSTAATTSHTPRPPDFAGADRPAAAPPRLRLSVAARRPVIVRPSAPSARLTEAPAAAGASATAVTKIVLQTLHRTLRPTRASGIGDTVRQSGFGHVTLAIGNLRQRHRLAANRPALHAALVALRRASARPGAATIGNAGTVSFTTPNDTFAGFDSQARGMNSTPLPGPRGLLQPHLFH